MMLVLDSAFLAGKVLYIILSLDCGLELAASLNKSAAEYCLLQIKVEWLFL